MVASLSSHLLIYLRLLPIHPPLTILLFRLLIHHPHPLQVQALLLPPPLRHPCNRVSLRLQKQVHNGNGRNVLCNCVLVVGYLSTHLLYVHLRHCLHQRGVHPRPIQSPTWFTPHQYAGYPMVESSQGPTNARGYNLCLRTKKQD